MIKVSNKYADKIFVLANFWKSKIYEKIFVDWNSKSRDIC